MPNHWTQSEVSSTVADYLEMLRKELRGEEYIKAEHRRSLKSKLNSRSDGAIELKHQNISAILFEEGLPFIDGYKPRGNYQQLLREVVLNHLQQNPDILQLVAKFTEKTPAASNTEANILVTPSTRDASEQAATYRQGNILQKPDYLRQEA